MGRHTDSVSRNRPAHAGPILALVGRVVLGLDRDGNANPVLAHAHEPLRMLIPNSDEKNILSWFLRSGSSSEDFNEFTISAESWRSLLEFNLRP